MKKASYAMISAMRVRPKVRLDPIHAYPRFIFTPALFWCPFVVVFGLRFLMSA